MIVPATKPELEKLLLTPREAADVLSVCEKTLWSMTAPRGPIPCVRLGLAGKSVRYSPAALAKWIEAAQQDSQEVPQ